MNTAPVVFTLSAFWWAQAGGVKSRTKGRLLTCVIWSSSVSRAPIKPALCGQPGLRSHVASGRQQHRAPHILQGPMNQSEPAEEFKVKYPSSMVSLSGIKTLIWVTLHMFMSRNVRTGSICLVECHIGMLKIWDDITVEFSNKKTLKNVYFILRKIEDFYYYYYHYYLSANKFKSESWSHKSSTFKRRPCLYGCTQIFRYEMQRIMPDYYLENYWLKCKILLKKKKGYEE